MNSEETRLKKLVVILTILHAIILIKPICIYVCCASMHAIFINIWIAACLILFLMPFMLFVIYEHKR